MYQGKFSRQGKTDPADIYEILEQRTRKNARRSAPGESKAPPRRETAAGSPAPRQSPAAPKSAKRVSPFLLGLLVFTFVFYLATFLGMLWLRGWLVDFQAAQPTTKSQQVFQELFADPDWDNLYEISGIREDREAFCGYMDQWVGSQELTFLETSAGLAQDTKKYIVRMGSEKVASFTLTDNAPEEDLPDWQLGTVEFFIQDRKTYRITVWDGDVVQVGGQVLGEDRIISRSQSPAGKYLPLFAATPKTVTYETEPLLTAPEVTVEDSTGARRNITFDGDSLYTLDFSLEEIPPELRERSLNTVKAYAEYMANEGGVQNLNKYFDKNSDTYAAIVATERMWIQTGSSYSFTNETVTDYRTYGDAVFTVRVSMDLNVTRSGDGSVKVTHIEQSLFFALNSGGTWMCIRMTSEDMEAWTTEVRLTFRDGEQILSSEFVDARASSLTCPTVTVPEGKVFLGWATSTAAADGSQELHLVLTPDDQGLVSLPQGNVLEPMTLYPVFE